MSILSAKYLGKKKTSVIYLPTGKEISVDLSKAFGGDASSFAPTDVLAGAYASCALSFMAVVSDKTGDDMTGTSLDVDYQMNEKHERITKFIFAVTFPPSLPKEKRDLYLKAFKMCPVHNSLDPNIEVEVNAK